MKLTNRHITVWGDSILKGYVYDPTQGSYRISKKNSVSRFAEATQTLIDNRCGFGMTTGKALERIRRFFERTNIAENEIVLIEFGGNDCDYHWAAISADPDALHIPKTPLDLFYDQFQAIIDIFKERNINPILMTLPPIDPVRYFEWVSRDLNKTHILNWLDDVNKIYRWQELYSNAINDLAYANNVHLINVRRDFLLNKRYSATVCEDGIHPNENGQDIICDAFLSYLDFLPDVI